MAVSIPQARKILGKFGKPYTDDHVTRVLNQFYGLAEVIAEIITARGSNEQAVAVDSDSGKGKNESVTSR